MCLEVQGYLFLKGVPASAPSGPWDPGDNAPCMITKVCDTPQFTGRSFPEKNILETTSSFLQQEGSHLPLDQTQF